MLLVKKWSQEAPEILGGVHSGGVGEVIIIIITITIIIIIIMGCKILAVCPPRGRTPVTQGRFRPGAKPGSMDRPR